MILYKTAKCRPAGGVGITQLPFISCLAATDRTPEKAASKKSVREEERERRQVEERACQLQLITIFSVGQAPRDRLERERES